jgi:hypothetical protein
MLVIVSVGLLLGAALVVAMLRSGGWRKLLTALSFLDIFGTGLAAWLLHSWILLVLMFAALLAWLVLVSSSQISASANQNAGMPA